MKIDIKDPRHNVDAQQYRQHVLLGISIALTSVSGEFTQPNCPNLGLNIRNSSRRWVSMRYSDRGGTQLRCGRLDNGRGISLRHNATLSNHRHGVQIRPWRIWGTVNTRPSCWHTQAPDRHYYCILLSSDPGQDFNPYVLPPHWYGFIRKVICF
jgi:hypothetical protein